VEANFAENGAWERLNNLAATPMAVESSLYTLPQKGSLQQSFPTWHFIAASLY
jgi:hypothetical protein